MTELVTMIAKSLVDKPEEVQVSEIIDNNGNIIVELRVAEEDMGKIIGKQGKIAKAIRTVVRSIGLKDEKKVNVDIIEQGK